MKFTDATMFLFNREMSVWLFLAAVLTTFFVLVILTRSSGGLLAGGWPRPVRWLFAAGLFYAMLHMVIYASVKPPPTNPPPQKVEMQMFRLILDADGQRIYPAGVPLKGGGE